MKLTVKFVASFLPLLLLSFLESGCTYALWTNGDLEACKEPAQNPDLRLFESQQRQDFLVVYDEYSERNGAIHRRAYWLDKNQSRVENQHAPVFARQNAAGKLTPIPVFYSTPVKIGFNGSFYALCDTNQQSFTLFSGNREIGSFDFPVYNDHWGKVEKIALTPFAVSADAAIVGGCAGIVFLYCLQGSEFQVDR